MTISRFLPAIALSIAVNPFASSGPVVKPIRETGGIAGRIVKVTTLDGGGPGSLRAAIEATGPRLVIFEIGGVIDLAGRPLVVREPDLTIAGQTAPDPGITLIRGSLTVETHDVVIQHIAVRPGDRAGGPVDALGAAGKSAHDVVFDHCSATWAIDENLSVSGPADSEGPDVTAHDVVFRHCLIAEGLSHSIHPKGEHSKGTLIHDGVRGVFITGCVFAHNRERNPRLKGGTSAVVVENVMYNWSSACVGVGARGNRRTLTPSEAVLERNAAIAGPDTRARVFVKSVDPGGRVFLRDNIAVDAAGASLPMTDDGVVCVECPRTAAPPWAIAAITLRTAGSRPARRDPIDARIIQSIIRGDGRIIDSQEQVGGYPVRSKATRALTVPDGVEERRRWLDRLANELAEDKSIDLAPLWKRFHVIPRAAPAPGSPE